MSEKVYQMVTDRMIEMMKGGRIPWRRPWSGGARGVSPEEYAVNYVTRQAYSPLNQMLLGMPGEWLTFTQIKALGGKLRKGSKAAFVVFYKQNEWTTENEDGEKVFHSYPVLRYYNVFHLNDVEGIASKIVPGEVAPVVEENDADAVINAYVSRTGVKFHNDKPSSRAYYSAGTDTVVVPMKGQYKDEAEYYSTTFHELVHSTMRADRCDRRVENRCAAFGSGDYSREELVAETGASMLCSVTGKESEASIRNNAAYLQGWMKALKDDPKMFVIAAGRAEKAARFILGQN